MVIYLLYVKLLETIHINRLPDGRHLFLLNKAEKSHDLVIMAGDQIYGDHTAIGGPIGAFSGLLLTYKHYLRLYRKFFARPAFSKVVAAMPTYMIFDDHEIKNGWSKHAFDSRKKKFKRAKETFNNKCYV